MFVIEFIRCWIKEKPRHNNQHWYWNFSKKRHDFRI